jgi:hypothetical protein
MRFKPLMVHSRLVSSIHSRPTRSVSTCLAFTNTSTRSHQPDYQILLLVGQNAHTRRCFNFFFFFFKGDVPFVPPPRTSPTTAAQPTPQPEFTPVQTPLIPNPTVTPTLTTSVVQVLAGTNNANSEINSASVSMAIVQATFIGTGSTTAQATLSDGCTTLVTPFVRVNAGDTVSFPPIDARSLQPGNIAVSVNIGGANGVNTPGTPATYTINNTTAPVSVFPSLNVVNIDWSQLEMK